MPRAPIAEIKAHAVDRIDDILGRLAPGGRFAGGMYTVRNPTRADKHAGSFVVYTRGRMAGAFIEFANRDEEKGDVIDLVAYLLAGAADFKGRAARSRAIEWIADFVGLDRMAPAQRAEAMQAANSRRLTDEQAEAQAQAKRARAFKMWLAARPLEAGDLAHVYLRGRGIDLAVIPNLETDLHFAPALEWWMGARRDAAGRKLAPGPSYPAIMAALRDAAGGVQAVHCTFLDRDGAGKAPVARPKLIWPDYSGCVIRLCRGEGNFAPESVPAPLDVDDAEFGMREHCSGIGPCIITEGIEDGLTAALGCRGEVRVWAAAALSNIANVPALPCVDAWLLHRQNDWHSRQALDQFEKAKMALEASGRAVVEIAALGPGKDLNDTLRGM